MGLGSRAADDRPPGDGWIAPPLDNRFEYLALTAEVDRAQNVVLPAEPGEYLNVWQVDVIPRTMDIREICAEQVRACSVRARYRDFYDLFLILGEHQVDFDTSYP